MSFPCTLSFCSGFVLAFLMSAALTVDPSAQSSPLSHAVLSGAHGDTMAAAPERGDLLVAQSFGESMVRWTKLERCEAKAFVGSNGVDTVCSTNGSRLTDLNAVNLSSGTVPDERLADNIARLDGQNPEFNPSKRGKFAPGTNTTWTFKTSADNAVATLLVSSEGMTVGATPDGYAQLQINAQDEVPTTQGTRIGSNMNAFLRVASQTFNNGECRDTLCPDMAELLSGGSLRLTTSGRGVLSFARRGKSLFTLDNDDFLKTYTSLFGFDEVGQQTFQLGPGGMEIGGGPDTGLYYPPRLPPDDAMTSRRWAPGSMRVASRLAVGCDIDSPFGRNVELSQTGDQAGLCVQPLRPEVNVAAFISTPRRVVDIPDVTGLRVTTTATENAGRNTAVSIAGANGGEGGQTTLKVASAATRGTDYGIHIDAAPGVEFPLAVRSNGVDRVLLCGDGGLNVGLSCAGSSGAGTIAVDGDLYKNSAASSPDYIFERYYTGRILAFADQRGAAAYPGLRDLSDLEAFTRTTHTLPDIAPGQGVFERQQSLLARLQEAYLYIFQLRRQLGDLEGRIVALEKR